MILVQVRVMVTVSVSSRIRVEVACDECNSKYMVILTAESASGVGASSSTQCSGAATNHSSSSFS